MAQATGGSAFYPQRLEDIANEFHRIEEELRSQYSLAYKPADFRADGSFRSIYLTAVRGGYVVHARTGYFAPSSRSYVDWAVGEPQSRCRAPLP